MSRTMSKAYVSAAWSKNRVDAEEQARVYCRELVAKRKLPDLRIMKEKSSRLITY